MRGEQSSGHFGSTCACRLSFIQLPVVVLTPMLPWCERFESSGVSRIGGVGFGFDRLDFEFQNTSSNDGIDITTFSSRHKMSHQKHQHHENGRPSWTRSPGLGMHPCILFVGHDKPSGCLLGAGVVCRDSTTEAARFKWPASATASLRQFVWTSITEMWDHHTLSKPQSSSSASRRTIPVLFIRHVQISGYSTNTRQCRRQSIGFGSLGVENGRHCSRFWNLSFPRYFFLLVESRMGAIVESTLRPLLDHLSARFLGLVALVHGTTAWRQESIVETKSTRASTS